MKQLLLVLTAIRTKEARSLVRFVLEDAGHRVVESCGYLQAVTLLENGLHPDLVVLESCSGGISIPEHRACAQLVARDRLCLVLGIGDEANAVGSLGTMAAHRLVRPVTREDVESLIANLGGVTVGTPGEAQQTEPRRVVSESSGPMAPSPLIEELGEGKFFLAASPAMVEIHRKAKAFGGADVNVLLFGESGTGKEIVAHLIHKHSLRSKKRFEHLNCAALPSELLESELLGYKQGAFAGAIRDHAGKFELADGGTLLLDEIGELPAHMQAKLLHVLQNGRFTPLGGHESICADVRVLAATRVPLQDALGNMTLREDLYNRLKTFTLHLPPLRKRREEIPLLMEEFVRRVPEEIRGTAGAKFSSRLMDAAMLCEWRGNLRELRNFVVRTFIMRGADAAMRELEAKVAVSPSAWDADASLRSHHRMGLRSAVRELRDQTEAQMMREALDRCGWNRRQAARYLKISYRGLLYKIQQHQLAPESGSAGSVSRQAKL